MFGETFVKEGEECVYFFVLSILDVKKGFASSSCNHLLEKRSLVRPCLRSHNQSATVEVLLQSTMNKLIVGPALRTAVNLHSSKLPKELAKSSAAFLSSAPSGGVVTLPDLPYDYAALERT